MFRRAASSAAQAGAASAGIVFAGNKTFTGVPTRCHSTGHSHGHGHGDSKMEMLEARISMLEANAATRYGVKQRTGAGNAIFSWDEELTAALPEECKPFEKDMHGGFNEDPDTGVVYTGIPGAGLYTISQDLKTWTTLGTDDRLKANIHGVVVFKHPASGQMQLALAQNNDQRVLIVNAADGAVTQELTAPRGGEFASGDCAGANAYYAFKRHIPRKLLGPDANATEKVFCCTDVTECNGSLYVVTGYCDGDFVLQANWCKDSGLWKWGRTAWGGKGEGAGRFQTAHGVFAHEGHIYVANREAHEVVKFTPEGLLVEVFPDIPAGSRICNIAYAKDEKYFVMNALCPTIDGTTYSDIRGDNNVYGAMRTAPIYAHDGNKLLATIDAGSLGIPVLKHLHHVWPHYATAADGSRQLYILVHGWRDGKFCVLKHEK